MTISNSLTAEQKDLLRGWVDALRSGKYKQGKKCLRLEDEFCCLGVAVDLFGSRVGLGWNSENTHCINLATGKVDRLVLPDAVSKLIGAPHNGHTKLTPKARKWLEGYIYKERDGTTTLAHLNDIGVPFRVIADIIEDTYLTPED